MRFPVGAYARVREDANGYEMYGGRLIDAGGGGQWFQINRYRNNDEDLVLDVSGLPELSNIEWVTRTSAIAEVSLVDREQVQVGDYIRIHPEVGASDLYIPSSRRGEITPDRFRDRLFVVTDDPTDGPVTIDTTPIGGIRGPEENRWNIHEGAIYSVVNVEENPELYAQYNSTGDSVEIQDCSRCGSRVPAQSLFTIAGQSMCRRCSVHSTFRCISCRETCAVDDGSVRYFDGGRVCYPCFDEHYTACDGCDEAVHLDDVQFDRLGEFCPECHGRHEDLDEDEDGEFEAGPIRAYHSCSADSIFGFGERDFNQQGNEFYIGIEMEYECRNSRIGPAEFVTDKLDGWAFCMGDGSLGDGFEIVSRPDSQRKVEEQFNRLFSERLTTTYGLQCKNHTGLHINISRSAFVSNYALALANVVCNNFEGLVESIGGREMRGFCESVYKSDMQAQEEANYGNDKYSAMHIKPSVVEFRLFRATTSASKFRKRLLFARFIVDYANECAVEGYTPSEEGIRQKIHNDDDYAALRDWVSVPAIQEEEAVSSTPPEPSLTRSHYMPGYDSTVHTLVGENEWAARDDADPESQRGLEQVRQFVQSAAGPSYGASGINRSGEPDATLIRALDTDWS